MHKFLVSILLSVRFRPRLETETLLPHRFPLAEIKTGFAGSRE